MQTLTDRHEQQKHTHSHCYSHRRRWPFLRLNTHEVSLLSRTIFTPTTSMRRDALQTREDTHLKDTHSRHTRIDSYRDELLTDPTGEHAAIRGKPWRRTRVCVCVCVCVCVHHIKQILISEQVKLLLLEPAEIFAQDISFSCVKCLIKCRLVQSLNIHPRCLSS